MKKQGERPFSDIAMLARPAAAREATNPPRRELCMENADVSAMMLRHV